MMRAHQVQNNFLNGTQQRCMKMEKSKELLGSQTNQKTALRSWPRSCDPLSTGQKHTSVSLSQLLGSK